MRYEVTTAGTFPPISVSDAKEQIKLRSGITADDTLIGEYLNAITREIELETNAVVATSTWKLHLDEIPDSKYIFINHNPVTAVASVKYYDSDNTLQTVSTADYEVITTGKANEGPARIYFYSTPSYKTRPEAIEITFTAGYTDQDSVDDEIKHAARLMIADCYNDRGTYVKGTIVNALPSKTLKRLKALFGSHLFI